MSDVKAIPDRCHSVNAYLVVTAAAEALEFYSKAFGAHSLSRMPGPDGKGTMHAEMVIGDSVVMLSDEFPQFNLKSPKSLGGNCASLHLYVEDADALFNQAVAAGCDVLHPVSDTFWGDRYGKVADPYGHHWGIATHVEDLTEEQMAERAKEAFANMDCGDAAG
jgi:PhnB protein